MKPRYKYYWAFEKWISVPITFRDVAKNVFGIELVRRIKAQCDWCTCGDELSIYPECEKCNGTGYYFRRE